PRLALRQPDLELDRGLDDAGDAAHRRDLERLSAAGRRERDGRDALRDRDLGIRQIEAGEVSALRLRERGRGDGRRRRDERRADRESEPIGSFGHYFRLPRASRWRPLPSRRGEPPAWMVQGRGRSEERSMTAPLRYI